MPFPLSALVLALGLFAALRPGMREGREGNRLLEAGDTDGAQAAYVSGLAGDGVPRTVEAALWHNLGVARLRASRGAEADSAFGRALDLADRPDDRARYAYDAGTAALLGGDARRAVDLLRRSLVLDARNADARRNFEIAWRLLHQDDSPPEPSDFARQLKARADALVAARRYSDAFDLMQDGLRQDSTVAAFADFVTRLGGVVDIDAAPDTTPAPAPAPTDSAP